MTTKTFIATILLSTFALNLANAQENKKEKSEEKNGFSGTISAQGGLGSATPWGGHIKLKYKADKWTLAPFAGITGISRQSSAEVEEIQFIYARSGSQFASTQTTEKEGFKLNVGTNLDLRFNAFNTLSTKIQFQQDRIKIYGVGHEMLSGKGTTQEASSLITTPALTHSKTDASATYTHIFTADNHLVFSYDFSGERLENDLHQDFTPNTGMSLVYQTIDTKRDAEIRHHTAKGEWIHFNAHPCILKIGARYDDREIESNGQQELRGGIAPDSNRNPKFWFNHRMQTTAAYADLFTIIHELPGDYQMTIHANVEYDYTKMQDRQLNDIVGNAQILLQFNESNSLSATYVRKIVRPDLDKLDPMRVVHYHTVDSGNINLEGIHINSALLTYKNIFQSGFFSATLTHINVKDGFNAIWKPIVVDGREVREYTWGNEGIRQAWSLAPAVQCTTPFATINAKATLLWDKRVAEAINMEKEHWGITAEASAVKGLPHAISLDVHGVYSEGNTIDLYSHESRSYKVGTALDIPMGKYVQLHLSYDYRDYARTIVTQGAFVGEIFTRPDNHHEATAKVTIKL